MTLTAKKMGPGVRARRRPLLPPRHCRARAPSSAGAHVYHPLRFADCAPCRDAQHLLYVISCNAMEIIESCGLERELDALDA